ncbi:MAG: THUMP domain-containing protein [Nitrososphaeria archaeon]
MEFNFVATTYRNLRKELEDELHRLLRDFEPIEFIDLNLNSVVAGRLNGDPIEASRRLYRAAFSDPWSVRRVLRFVPVQINCRADVQEMAKRASEVLSSIGSDQTYKIEAELRLTGLRWGEIISAIASSARAKVDLKKPTYLLVVEIIGEDCGMSLIKKEDLFRSLDAKLAGSYFP